ncbi:HAD family hydrolase [Salinicola rhizosphaerae]|uniref:Hydrolase n=1 Tax=Salinicola rhizosphaerae TaxID=1443141 RepID=A0ABQ3DQU6_9GAMM|nr:HAD family hydrolase [Salinicola rhizosphaerae]GHB12341.1 hydrolase [Salinicola rhizosphaerae]
MPLDAITFDLDDTLWHNGPVMAEAEPGHYRWLVEQIDARPDADGRSLAQAFPLEAYQQVRASLMQRFPLSRGDHSWIRERAMFELLREHGLSETEATRWATLGFEQFMSLRHAIDVHPEVAPMFDAWARRYRLGVITNGNVDVGRLALDHHFDAIILAGEMHAPKPDTRPFLSAVFQLGTVPHRALHVGDNWEEDVLGAHRLGMHAVWIDAKNEGERELPPRVHRVTHVRELPEIVAWLDGR